MRPSALQYLACPRTGGPLVADADETAPDGHILRGTLLSGSGDRYPITGGIPRLVPKGDARDDAAEAATRAAVAWKRGARSPRDEQRFLDRIAPLAPRDFIGKTVLEGGCGDGRHTELVARWGAEAIVALDLGDAVEAAFRATRHLANAHVVEGDLTRPPVARVFDLGFALGVLDHLPDPVVGFRALCGRVVTGGRVSIWVHGRESNEWLVRTLDPLRRHVTSRLPEDLVYWASLPPAVMLAAALRLYRFRALARRLPYGEALAYMSEAPVGEVHHAVFEQLVTPIAHFLPGEVVRSWFEVDDFEHADVSWHRKSSWRATARVVGHRHSTVHQLAEPERGRTASQGRVSPHPTLPPQGEG